MDKSTQQLFSKEFTETLVQKVIETLLSDTDIVVRQSSTNDDGTGGRYYYRTTNLKNDIVRSIAMMTCDKLKALSTEIFNANEKTINEKVKSINQEWIEKRIDEAINKNITQKITDQIEFFIKGQTGEYWIENGLKKYITGYLDKELIEHKINILTEQHKTAIKGRFKELGEKLKIKATTTVEVLLTDN